MNEEQCHREWEEQVAYVKANQDSIRKKYGSDYIAVQNGQVLDHDKDQFALARRIEGKVDRRDKFVLISTLEQVLNPEPEFMGGPQEEA